LLFWRKPAVKILTPEFSPSSPLFNWSSLSLSFFFVVVRESAGGMETPWISKVNQYDYGQEELGKQ
jgi:hypothetical protein